jgi:hypothetical protein
MCVYVRELGSRHTYFTTHTHTHTYNPGKPTGARKGPQHGLPPHRPARPDRHQAEGFEADFDVSDVAGTYFHVCVYI